MELYFLDSGFRRMTKPIDTALSVVFSHRFFECGTFRVIFPRDSAILAAARAAVWLCTGVDNRGEVICGRIEYIGFGEEDRLEISGRMLECILSDRVMVGPWSYTGSVSDAVFAAVTNNRRGLSVELGSDSPVISDSITAVSEWEEVSDWIYKTLRPFGASYRVTLDVERGVPVFRLVVPKGEATAVFSASFENIASVEYQYHDGEMKNAAFVEGFDGTVAEYDCSGGSERREVFRRSADIRPGQFGTEKAYLEALKGKGRTILGACTGEEYITCRAEADGKPVFGRDYQMGDLCYLDDAGTGISVRTRVTEADEVWEDGCRTVYPAFGGRLPGIKNKLKGI